MHKEFRGKLLHSSSGPLLFQQINEMQPRSLASQYRGNVIYPIKYRFACRIHQRGYHKSENVVTAKKIVMVKIHTKLKIFYTGLSNRYMVMASESIARKLPHLSLIQNCMSSINLVSQYPHFFNTCGSPQKIVLIQFHTKLKIFITSSAKR